jgi:CheY-like chemotaxis protein
MRPVVLLSVDNDDARAAYAYALVANGFDVTSAGSAPSPQDLAALHPSVIVVEVSERSGGWPRVRTFKREALTSEVPIVAVAGDAGAVTQDRARREGCAALCPVTCPPAVLASGLRAVLERDGRSRHRSSA